MLKTNLIKSIKKLIFISVFVFPLLFVSCTCSKQEKLKEKFSDTTYKNDNEVRCEESNPFEEDSGHYAGYEWAEQNNPSSCDGNSDSFIEGCQKYLDQKECTHEKNK